MKRQSQVITLKQIEEHKIEYTRFKTENER
jgi:hypothetical protein